MTELLSHSLFVGRVACPSRCIEPLNPHNHYKRTIIPSPRTITLASLVKGEVLSPERIRATTGGIATPLSPRPAPTLPKTALSLSLFVRERACSSRCTEYCHSHNNCKKTIIPQKSPSHLPPLSKGGGLTVRHKLLLCCVLIAYPRPFYHQTFLPSRRRDCYIPSPHTNPSKPALSHPLFVLRVRQPHLPQK